MSPLPFCVALVVYCRLIVFSHGQRFCLLVAVGERESKWPPKSNVLIALWLLSSQLSSAHKRKKEKMVDIDKVKRAQNYLNIHRLLRAFTPPVLKLGDALSSAQPNKPTLIMHLTNSELIIHKPPNNKTMLHHVEIQIKIFLHSPAEYFSRQDMRYRVTSYATGSIKLNQLRMRKNHFLLQNL